MIVYVFTIMDFFLDIIFLVHLLHNDIWFGWILLCSVFLSVSTNTIVITYHLKWTLNDPIFQDWLQHNISQSAILFTLSGGSPTTCKILNMEPLKSPLTFKDREIFLNNYWIGLCFENIPQFICSLCYLHFYENDNIAVLTLISSAVIILYYILVVLFRLILTYTDVEIRICTIIKFYDLKKTKEQLRGVFCSLLKNQTAQIYCVKNENIIWKYMYTFS
eukprot:UN34047